jgi:lysozyme family protein
VKSFGHPLIDHSFEKLEPDYHIRFERMKVTELGVHKARSELSSLRTYRSHYNEVEILSKVPWYWVGLTHIREAGDPPNFHAWLHNGDPMFNHNRMPVQTVHVPRHRPPDPNVSWEQGAFDALQQLHLVGIADWGPERCALAWEKFNGFGYRDFHGMPSPYLWGGTTEQLPGKYTSDGHFDSGVMDEQLGAMAVLKLILEEKIA